MDKLWTALGLTLMVTFFVSQAAQADAVIEFDNGWTLDVPAGWEVSIHPEGFNNRPYDPETNPAGKLSGWGGYPWYNLWLEAQGCGPDDGTPKFSPQPECPPQPEFYEGETQCYFEPPPPLCVERDGGPYFSPRPPFCDEKNK